MRCRRSPLSAASRCILSKMRSVAVAPPPPPARRRCICTRVGSKSTSGVDGANCPFSYMLVLRLKTLVVQGGTRSQAR
jgi:hypothetical protein